MRRFADSYTRNLTADSYDYAVDQRSEEVTDQIMESIYYALGELRIAMEWLGADDCQMGAVATASSSDAFEQMFDMCVDDFDFEIDFSIVSRRLETAAKYFRDLAVLV